MVELGQIYYSGELNVKKWSYLLSGILIGAVVATAGNAFADQVKSLIGEKVAGEYTVKVNGSSLTENAIVVDGKAHVPLRAVSDSLGAGIKVDGKTIQIDTQSKTESSVEEKNTSLETPNGNNNNSQEIIDSIKSYRAFWERSLEGAEESQVKFNKRIEELTNLPASNDPITQENRKKSLAHAQEMIEENNKKIAEYKAKIAEIDAQLAAKLNK
jgi:uncharacterized protein YlzI (FlbEa/FlbD family)